MGKYSIQTQASAKTLEVMVEGTFQQQDAQNFISEFMKETGKIVPAQYELRFNCSKLDVSSQQMVPVLQGCMEMYKKLNFKKVVINTFGNVILKMQLDKVISTVKMVNTVLV